MYNYHIHVIPLLPDGIISVARTLLLGTHLYTYTVSFDNKTSGPGIHAP